MKSYSYYVENRDGTALTGYIFFGLAPFLTIIFALRSEINEGKVELSSTLVKIISRSSLFTNWEYYVVLSVVLILILSWLFLGLYLSTVLPLTSLRYPIETVCLIGILIGLCSGFFVNSLFKREWTSFFVFSSLYVVFAPFVFYSVLEAVYGLHNGIQEIKKFNDRHR